MISTDTAMSTATDDNDAYTTVKRRSKSSSKHQKMILVDRSLNDLVAEKQSLLAKSSFEIHCKPEEALSRLKNCKHCLCLGLGSLRGSPKSLLQCALLLMLRECLAPDAIITVSDPAFNVEDEFYFESLNMRVLSSEDIELRCNGPTFVYMPHCPRSLHEALLSMNESNLDNLVLLSNDLASYAENVLRASKHERDRIPLLCLLGHKFSRIAMPGFEEYPEAFNDMAWQWLQPNVTSSL